MILYTGGGGHFYVDAKMTVSGTCERCRKVRDQFNKFVNPVLLKQNLLNLNFNNFREVYDFKGNR